MNFNILKHDTFSKWIPETDIDGVDADDSFLSVSENAILGNGFVSNSLASDSVKLSDEMLEDIHSNGYDILSAKSFLHSKRGLTTIYVLWSDSADDKLIIYVNSAGELTKLYIDDGTVVDGVNTKWVYTEKPNHINYNVVNDQLKINLNCTAKYIPTDTNVILNLSLVYLIRRYYTNDIVREEGWYLVPRWLGNKKVDGINFVNPTVPFASYTENFNTIRNGNLLLSEYMTLQSSTSDWHTQYVDVNANDNVVVVTRNKSQIVLNNVILNQVVVSARAFYYQLMTKKGEESWHQWEGDVVSQPGGLSRRIKVYEVGKENQASVFDLTEQYTDYTVRLDMKTYNTVIIETIDGYNIVGTVKPKDDELSIVANIEYMFNTVTMIFNNKMNALSLIGVTDDGQRSLLDYKTNVKYDGFYFFRKDFIDWRFVKYEVYMQTSNISYLMQEFETGKMNVASPDQATNLPCCRINLIKNNFDNITLNNKYNLPAYEYVNYQRKIYSEVTLKNRVYFVNENDKVYQGHISSNLAIQADCFPFNEEVGFGYFNVSKQRKNLALGISPTNDLVVFTDCGVLVYFIQANQSGAFKTLKMLSNNISIIPATLTKTVNNDSATNGLIWADENGIYLYQGGMELPINLIRPTHERWWRSLSSVTKSGMVGMYNYIDDEYWLRVGSDTLVFEIPYKRFNYKKNISFNEQIGYNDGKIYYRTANGVRSYPSTNYTSYTIATHSNIAYSKNSLAVKSQDHVILSEINDKILQEVYIIFGNSNSANILLSIYIDDNLLGTYSCSTNRRYQKFLVPLGVKFNRIKFKMDAPNVLVRIKEVGCLFVPDTNEPLGSSTAGLDTGYGFTYGSNYGGGL